MNVLTLVRASTELTLLAWLFTGLLLVLLIACMLAGRGILPLNPLFGIRLPALMSSSDAWRVGHQAAVMPSAVAFVVALVFSALGLLAPAAYFVAIAAFVGGFVWVAIRGSLAAAQITR